MCGSYTLQTWCLLTDGKFTSADALTDSESSLPHIPGIESIHPSASGLKIRPMSVVQRSSKDL